MPPIKTIKNRGLVPLLKGSEFKLVHPVDLGNWLLLGWQPVAVRQEIPVRTNSEKNYESEELEGVGPPFNAPGFPQKSYNYWDSQNDAFYRWDVAQQQWVILAATENSYMSPAQIRDSLESLPMGEKLDSSAIANLPSPYLPPIPISDVAHLQTRLEAKADVNHNHAIANVSGLSTSLANKASVIHNHAIADIENLQNTLNSKAASVHNHRASSIADLDDVLSGYANAIHQHEINSIVGLSGVLNKIDEQLAAISRESFSVLFCRVIARVNKNEILFLWNNSSLDFFGVEPHEGILGENVAEFISSKIQIELNGIELLKEIEAIWISPDSIAIAMALDPGDYLSIKYQEA